MDAVLLSGFAKVKENEIKNLENGKKNIEIGTLYEFYGKLLTDKQREMYTLKYEDDLSITEIAEEFGISKQGVSDSINKTEKALNDYENKLHLVERFENEGLTLKDYISCCINQPSLFCRSPETLENNVRGFVKKFENDGLTIKDYIKCCVKQPQLFCMAPETIAEHIRAFMYVGKNNDVNEGIMQNVLKKNLTYSTSMIYLQGIVLPQLKQQDAEIKKWGSSKTRENLQKYFEEHPDKKFTIKVIEDETSDNFTKTIKEYWQKELGRDDMFEIKIIK